MAAVLAEITWSADTIMAIGGVLVMAGIPLAAILGAYWYKLNRARSDNELKQAMVERGMSAADIERVMAAGEAGKAGGSDPDAAARGSGPLAANR